MAVRRGSTLYIGVSNASNKLMAFSQQISIYRLDDETKISQDIDLAILKALLKGMVCSIGIGQSRWGSMSNFSWSY